MADRAGQKIAAYFDGACRYMVFGGKRWALLDGGGTHELLFWHRQQVRVFNLRNQLRLPVLKILVDEDLLHILHGLQGTPDLAPRLEPVHPWHRRLRPHPGHRQRRAAGLARDPQRPVLAPRVPHIKGS